MDLLYAKNICDEKPKDLKKFHNDFYERTLFKANQFVSKYKINDTFWNHHTKGDKSYTIKVTDDVSDTYLFLIKYLIKKSCKYTGLSGATLDTYLTAVLNSNFTKSDWKKHIFGGLAIPKAIKSLSKEHQTVFKSLKHKHPDNLIASKINKSMEETKLLIIEVKTILIQNGLTYMIEDPLIVSITNIFNQDEDEDKDDNVIDENQVNISELNDAQEIINILLDSYSQLIKDDKKLIRMYWDNRISAKHIFEHYFKNKDEIISFDKLIIKKESQVNTHVNRIINLLDEYLKNKHCNFYENANLNLKKTTAIFKLYIENWDSSSNNFWKNNEKN